MSERKLVTLRRIDEILPIEGADAIELAKIGGWQAVVKKDEFQEGDICVYFEIDSFVPVDVEPFKFLVKNKITWNGKEGARIKTIKLRGQLSQGLALHPINVFAAESKEVSFFEWVLRTYEAEEDLTEICGVEKWEPVIPANLAGKVRGNFPSFLRKTDQERIQNLDVDKLHGYYEVTMKLDGSSMTVYRHEGRFGVCSRNLDLIETEDNSFWRVARALKIEEMMVENNYDNIAFQGELMGPGVQGNKEGLKELEFFIFDIFDETRGYIDAFDRRFIVEALGLTHAPVIEQALAFTMTMEEALAYADGPSINAKLREGVVFKNLDDPSKSFKVISNAWLMKNGE